MKKKEKEKLKIRILINIKNEKFNSEKPDCIHSLNPQVLPFLL